MFNRLEWLRGCLNAETEYLQPSGHRVTGCLSCQCRPHRYVFFFFFFRVFFLALCFAWMRVGYHNFVSTEVEGMWSLSDPRCQITPRDPTLLSRSSFLSTGKRACERLVIFWGLEKMWNRSGEWVDQPSVQKQCCSRRRGYWVALLTGMWICVTQIDSKFPPFFSSSLAFFTLIDGSGRDLVITFHPRIEREKKGYRTPVHNLSILISGRWNHRP